ncbi:MULTISPECIES: UPF0149 family protein [Pseudoalteromonas]|uniref:YecA family protein n=1 Tax=Pseudoalteromonas amylolytica TaxID=1859457 RepID=A0A1S1MK45_9GAMM|nr:MULTISPECIES: UPF0149 family protein [Pseudoalteromonas]OHU86875.1 hypothetical protein BET10_01375 [Pseudoalteromonas amylolytica]OHU89466.1 hypothetical protein BFC16_04775 [Pseudoalteromonas sp. JW3]
MLDFSFTVEHEKLLADYLAARSEAMSLAMTKGYLFALICGPNAVEVEQWLHDISAADDNMDESVVFAFMALHHQISEQVFAGNYQLPWTAHSDYQSRHQWSVGFITAAQPYFEAILTAEKLSNELKEALQVATEQLAFFSLSQSQVSEYCQQINCDETEFLTQQSELAGEFAKGFAQLIEVVAVDSGLYDDEDAF